jgi:hypothetical protein
MVVLRSSPFFLRHSTSFLSTRYILFFSEQYDFFLSKPNLFLSRFFYNFTPILSFFLFRIFFVGGVFFVHSLKLKIMKLFFLTTYPHHVSAGGWFIEIVFFLVIFVLYILRGLPIFNILWHIVKVFLWVLLLTLGWGYIKKKWDE